MTFEELFTRSFSVSAMCDVMDLQECAEVKELQAYMEELPGLRNDYANYTESGEVEAKLTEYVREQVRKHLSEIKAYVATL